MAGLSTRFFIGSHDAFKHFVEMDSQYSENTGLYFIVGKCSDYNRPLRRLENEGRISSIQIDGVDYTTPNSADNVKAVFTRLEKAFKAKTVVATLIDRNLTIETSNSNKPKPLIFEIP